MHVFTFGDNKVSINAGLRGHNGEIILEKLFKPNIYSKENVCDSPCYLVFKDTESIQILIDSLEHVKRAMLSEKEKRIKSNEILS